MKIGIDLDDVVVDTSKYAYRYLLPLFRGNKEIMDNLKDFARGKLTNDNMFKVANKYAPKVWKKAKLKPDALEVLNRLKESGHELIYITARNNNINPEAETITYRYFNKHGLPYDKIIFGTYNKRKTCLDEKVDVFIDDSVDTCNDLDKHTSITVYLFDSIVNRKLPSNVQRVKSWYELETKINSVN